MAHLEATHQAHLGALGEEYVAPMQSGARPRELAEANPYSTLKSGRGVSNPLWDVADRDIRRGFSSRKRYGPAAIECAFEAWATT